MSTFRKIETTFADPDQFEDADEVYGDEQGECTGECLSGIAITAECGTVRCAYCGKET